MMAISRLRQSLFSRAPCLYRHRLLSSSIPSTRFSFSKALSKDENGSLLRCTSISTITGFLGGLSKIKLQLQFGVRHMSSAEDPSHIVLEMPALSPTMSQGNIAKWKKKEGDKIDVGDVLCEIETDKAIVEYESLEECFLAKILAPEGSKDIPVGQAIAVTVEDPDDISKVPSIGGGSEVKEGKSALTDVGSQDKESETVAVKIDASQLPSHIVLDMPALSPTMNQGNIAKWQKKEGDRIEVGDILCEIETDKATLEYESLEEGYLAIILAPDGTKDVAVGQPIAVTVEALEDVETVKDSYTRSSAVKEEKPTSLSNRSELKEQNSGISRISPSAKLLISEYGLDASLLSSSGPRGTLLKGDVLAAIKSGKGSSRYAATVEQSQSPRVELLSIRSSTPQSVSYEDLSNSQIRKVIARRLLESKQSTPHLYLSTDVILDPLLLFKNELKENHTINVSVNDIVIKAVAIALHNVPDANGFWDAEKGKVMFNDSVDISVAVATEKGLMTPIVRNANEKTISAISSEVKDLAEKARAGKLKPDEFQGGTFSISNLGMYPVDHFCAIINPPQAGILAVGRGNKVVEPISGSGTEELIVVTKMNLTLSADHRVFDGKVGGEFLKAIRANFSDLKRLLL